MGSVICVKCFSWLLLYESQNNPLQVMFLHLLYKWGKWGGKRWSKLWSMTISLCCHSKPCLSEYLYMSLTYVSTFLRLRPFSLNITNLQGVLISTCYFPSLMDTGSGMEWRDYKFTLELDQPEWEAWLGLLVALWLKANYTTSL